jgi:hypothetical protein
MLPLKPLAAIPAALANYSLSLYSQVCGELAINSYMENHYFATKHLLLCNYKCKRLVISLLNKVN